MPIYLIDKIKQKNGGSFGMADTVDIDHTDGRRLNVVLDELKATAESGGSGVTALTKRVDTAEGNITALQTEVGKKAEINDAAASATTAYSGSKVEDAITAAKKAVKDELLGGAGEAFDTLKELGDAITTNSDAIDALKAVAAGHVKYDEAQKLTDAQKTQARGNIGAASAADLTAGLATKLNATELKAPAAEGDKVALGSLTSEGEFLVTSPNERPSNFNADPLLVSVRRRGTIIVQMVGGIDDGRYQLYGRTGTITAASGEKPESIAWTAFTEIGAQPDLSSYATKTEVAAVKTTADAAKTAADENKASLGTLKTTVDANSASITTLSGQVETNTKAIQTNASDITSIKAALGDATDYVATFEAALK